MYWRWYGPRLHPSKHLGLFPIRVIMIDWLLFSIVYITSRCEMTTLGSKISKICVLLLVKLRAFSENCHRRFSILAKTTLCRKFRECQLADIRKKCLDWMRKLKNMRKYRPWWSYKKLARRWDSERDFLRWHLQPLLRSAPRKLPNSVK